LLLTMFTPYSFGDSTKWLTSFKGEYINRCSEEFSSRIFQDFNKKENDLPFANRLAINLSSFLTCKCLAQDIEKRKIFKNSYKSYEEIPNKEFKAYTDFMKSDKGASLFHNCQSIAQPKLNEIQS